MVQFRVPRDTPKANFLLVAGLFGDIVYFERVNTNFAEVTYLCFYKCMESAEMVTGISIKTRAGIVTGTCSNTKLDHTRKLQFCDKLNCDCKVLGTTEQCHQKRIAHSKTIFSRVLTDPQLELLQTQLKQSLPTATEAHNKVAEWRAALQNDTHNEVEQTVSDSNETEQFINKEDYNNDNKNHEDNHSNVESLTSLEDINKSETEATEIMGNNDNNKKDTTENNISDDTKDVNSSRVGQKRVGEGDEGGILTRSKRQAMATKGKQNNKVSASTVTSSAL